MTYEIETTTSKQTLPTHEWLAVLTTAGFMILLIAISQCSSTRVFDKQITQAEPHYLYDQTIEVMVTGAVEHPGKYSFKKGAVMQEVLTQAVPTSDANIKRIRPQSKLRNGQVVNIPTTTKRT